MFIIKYIKLVIKYVKQQKGRVCFLFNVYLTIGKPSGLKLSTAPLAPFTRPRTTFKFLSNITYKTACVIYDVKYIFNSIELLERECIFQHQICCSKVNKVIKVQNSCSVGQGRFLSKNKYLLLFCTKFDDDFVIMNRY